MRKQAPHLGHRGQQIARNGMMASVMRPKLIAAHQMRDHDLTTRTGHPRHLSQRP